MAAAVGTAVGRAPPHLTVEASPPRIARALAGIAPAMIRAATVAPAHMAVGPAPSHCADAGAVLAGAIEAAATHAAQYELARRAAVPLIATARAAFARAPKAARRRTDAVRRARGRGAVKATPASGADAAALRTDAVAGAAGWALCLCARGSSPPWGAGAPSDRIALPPRPAARSVDAQGCRDVARLACPARRADAHAACACPVRPALRRARQHVARRPSPAHPAAALAICTAITMGAAIARTCGDGAVERGPALVARAHVVVANASPRAVVGTGRRRAVGTRPQQVARARAIGARPVGRAVVRAERHRAVRTGISDGTVALIRRRALAVNARRVADGQRAIRTPPAGVTEAAEQAVPHAEGSVARTRGRERTHRRWCQQRDPGDTDPSHHPVAGGGNMSRHEDKE